MANIPAWAFTPDQEEEAKRRRDRYEEIRYLRPQMNLRSSPQYAQTRYWGSVPAGVTLSDLDILILCDDGNTCFGGTVNRTGSTFSATVYTD